MQTTRPAILWVPEWMISIHVCCPRPHLICITHHFVTDETLFPSSISRTFASPQEVQQRADTEQLKHDSYTAPVDGTADSVISFNAEQVTCPKQNGESAGSTCLIHLLTENIQSV